jgi:hypothetical protein
LAENSSAGASRTHPLQTLITRESEVEIRFPELCCRFKE